MKSSGFFSVSGRRALMAIGVAVLLCVSSNVKVSGAPKAQDAAAQQDPLKLNIDGPAILVFRIKKDRTADFEALWPAIRAGLAKSSKEDLKEFAATLTPYKVKDVEGFYVFNLDHPSKTYSYNPIALLYYTDAEAIKRDEADTILKKWTDSSEGVNIWPLLKLGN